MINHINQIAKLITEDPDIINNKTILRESIEKDIKKLLTRIKSKLNHDINIDEITKFSTQQQYKELGISKWLAKQIAINPNLRVDWQSLTDYIAHIKLREPSKYKSLFKKKLSEVEVESEEWHSQFQANDDVTIADDEPIITQLPNGYKIVKLTKPKHCSAEGAAMGHCVGSYDPEVDDLYSLRDPRGRPHVTIQIEDGKINQIKGKQNEPPIRKYAELVIPWVNSILKEPGELFSNPLINFTMGGFSDYIDSLGDEDLRKLAGNGNSYTRTMVARSPNAPPDVLTYLVNIDNDDNIKYEVANNPNVPVDLLRLLSMDNSSYVRIGVAANKNTPPDILRNLADSNHDDIRYEVAHNSNTPPDILVNFVNDSTPSLRSAAVLNPNIPVYILRSIIKSGSSDDKHAAAFNTNAPPDVLRELANSNSHIKRAVAFNHNTPPDVLRKLANSSHDDIRHAVSLNPNTPYDTLKILTKDSNVNIRKIAINKINGRRGLGGQ